MKPTFASHPKSEFWSAKNEGKPEDYALNSHKKCWFDCNLCGHDFEKILKQINLSSSWCPYCVVPTKRLCGNYNCNFCLKKSDFSCRFDLVSINISFAIAMNLAGKKLLKSVNNTNILHNQLNHIINGVRSLSSTSFCARMPRTSFMPLPLCHRQFK